MISPIFGRQVTVLITRCSLLVSFCFLLFGCAENKAFSLFSAASPCTENIERPAVLILADKAQVTGGKIDYTFKPAKLDISGFKFSNVIACAGYWRVAIYDSDGNLLAMTGMDPSTGTIKDNGFLEADNTDKIEFKNIPVLALLRADIDLIVGGTTDIPKNINTISFPVLFYPDPKKDKWKDKD